MVGDAGSGVVGSNGGGLSGSKLNGGIEHVAPTSGYVAGLSRSAEMN
ncbi:hypothetical protein [Rhodococcus sp. WS3]